MQEVGKALIGLEEAGPMRLSRAVAVALLTMLLVIAGCSDKGPVSVSFHWVSAEFGHISRDKAAILVPVTVAGKKALVQLDTGSSSTVLLRKRLDILGVGYKVESPANTSGQRSVCRVDISLGTYQVRGMKVQLKEETLEPETVALLRSQVQAGKTLLVGTLGTDFFEDTVLVLDLPKQEIQVMFRSPSHEGKVVGVIAEGRPTCVLSVDGRNVKILLDTGSASFSLIVTEEVFSDIRVRWSITPMPDVTLKVPSWGQDVDFFGYSSEGQIDLADLRLPVRMIWLSPLMEEVHSTMGFDGIMGMEMLAEFVVIFDFIGDTVILAQHSTG